MWSALSSSKENEHGSALLTSSGYTVVYYKALFGKDLLHVVKLVQINMRNRAIRKL